MYIVGMCIYLLRSIFSTICKIDCKHRCDFSNALLPMFQVVAGLNAYF